MPGYWALRIDQPQRQFFLDEIANGRLRGGWGYLPEQNLRSIRAKLQAGQAIGGDERATWRRVRRFLSDESDGIQVGDVVIVPHLHKYGTWSIVRVKGPYEFSIPAMGDCGHYLPAEYAVNQEIDPYGADVSAQLRQSMRNQLPLWSLAQHQKAIDFIIAAAASGALAQVPNEQERLLNMLDALASVLWEKLRHHYQSSEFETPCRRLMERLFDGVEKRAGSSEHGADFLCTHLDPLGTTHTVAVQVKMWEGGAGWERPLNQIREAHQSYPLVTSAIILTTATHEEPSFEQARFALEKELGIPVRTICRDELLRLFLRHLPEIVDYDSSGSLS